MARDIVKAYSAELCSLVVPIYMLMTLSSRRDQSPKSVVCPCQW